MEETWKPVAIDDRYEVSNLGNVRSWNTRGTGGRSSSPRILKPVVDGSLYCWVSLGGRVRESVHRLVLDAFIGPCPPGMETRHLDGNPGNNRVDNLAWGTRQQNMCDKIIHGTSSGRTGNFSWKKLTEEDVLKIRESHRQGTTRNQIAKQWKMSWRQISNIVNYESWKDVP